MVIDREQHFFDWKKNPNPENLGKVVNAYKGILYSELPKYKGNLPENIIKSYGKKYVIDAIKTFDPKKGKLANHIASRLRQLNRINYNTSSSFRMSEELQQGVNVYKNGVSELQEKLNRHPSIEEISGYLSWTPSKVRRLQSQTKKEVDPGKLEVAPAFVTAGDPIIDYLYHDLNDVDKLIFQHRTGYKKAPILKTVELAKLINASPATVSVRALKIANILKEVMNRGR